MNNFNNNNNNNIHICLQHLQAYKININNNNNNFLQILEVIFRRDLFKIKQEKCLGQKKKIN